MMRKRELVRTVFPEGMEEFQQLLYCEGKQKGTLLEASVRAQLFCNMIVSVITYGAKLLNADWLRQRAFFLNHEGTFGNQEGMIT